MDLVSPEHIRLRVEDGYEISWIGVCESLMLGVRLRNGRNDTIVYMDPSTLETPKNAKLLRHVEATEELGTSTGVTWLRGGWLKVLRTASIYGINNSSYCKVGTGIAAMPEMPCCTMGYDIEVSQSLTRNGSFPPLYSKITSIALWCTCGYCEAWTTLDHDAVNGITYCASSKSLVRKSLCAMMRHMPKWLVGYNCYQFDNCCLRYHCPRDLKHLFRPMVSGSKSKLNFNFYIDLPGVNNVDLYVHLDKSMRGSYRNLSLNTVAEEHKIAGKSIMPKGESAKELYELVWYNIGDSRIAAELWYATGACSKILGLCSVSCAPMIDCTRQVSGTMASCAMSSYCLSKNMLMDWSKCDLELEYEGGLVLEPKRGLFRNVVVCDFSSMYPTIMQDVGLSPENIRISKHSMDGTKDKLLNWKDGVTLISIRGSEIAFDSNERCGAGDVLSDNTRMRTKHKKSKPDYANSLKVVSNSLFGALGYQNSPLYSPRVAATITLLGRTALSLVCSIFTGLGLIVVYGDTDSCFLVAGRKTRTHFGGSLNEHVAAALTVVHRVLSFTPLTNLKMEREDTIDSMIIVDKKHYAYTKGDNEIGTKGLSHTRKDRIGICREATRLVASAILNSKSVRVAREILEVKINQYMGLVSSGDLDAHSVSKEVRYEGTVCYAFSDVNNETTYIPVTIADRVKSVRYNVRKVLETLERDLNRICVPSGVGCVSDILKSSNIIF